MRFVYGFVCKLLDSVGGIILTAVQFWNGEKERLSYRLTESQRERERERETDRERKRERERTLRAVSP